VRHANVVDHDTEVDTGGSRGDARDGGVEAGSVGSIGNDSLGGDLVLGLCAQSALCPSLSTSNVSGASWIRAP
jgi:hypothetical protein